MKQDLLTAGYFVVMAGLIIALDVMFLRDHFWWRLGANVTIVVVFATVYLTLLRNLFKQ